MTLQSFAKRYFQNNKSKSASDFIGAAGLCGYSVDEIFEWTNDPEFKDYNSKFYISSIIDLAAMEWQS